MCLDDETTASQLYVLLSSLGHHLHLRTILKCRTSLGQLIREPNKQKRPDFAWEYQNDNFMSILFTDKCCMQLESYRKQCCRKQGEPAKNKPQLAFFHCKLLMTSGGISHREKHPVKVHVCAGISIRG